jgi:hypothetical protein
MIFRFLESMDIKGIGPPECQMLLKKVVDQMNNTGFNLSPRKLDNLIWNYQRKIPGKFHNHLTISCEI